jgi:hypothetical protein
VSDGSITISQGGNQASVTDLITAGALNVLQRDAAGNILPKAEDAAHASGDAGFVALAVRRDTAAVGSGTDGDYSTLNVNSSGRLYASATIDAALPAGTNNIGDVDVLSLPALPAGTNNIGDVDVLSLPALPAGTNNIGDVDVLTLPGIAGTAAHDSGVSGNPVLNGFEARTSDGTAVSNGDAVRGLADTLGKQVVLVGAVHDRQTRGTATYTNTTAADLIAAAGAGVRIAVMGVLVTNAHATVGTKVEIRDGTTVKVQGYAAAAGGGFSLPAGSTPLFISTANTAVTGRCVTTGADVDVTVWGYLIAN